jgi:hypothetical protein
LAHFFHSSLAERYISGVIQTTMQLTFTVTFDPELDFLKVNRIICLQCGVHLPHFLTSSLAQRYVSGLLQTYLQLTVTVTYDAELDSLKQNWVMSAEWITLDSFRPFLSCTGICVRGNTDISGINSYGYM